MTQNERAKEIAMLKFLVVHAKTITSTLEGRCMIIESSLSSDIWKHSTLVELPTLWR